MSNLQLPNLTYDVCKSMIEKLPVNGSGVSGKSVAYATGIGCHTYNGSPESIRTIFVYHHTSVIASLWAGVGNLRITNAGYRSSTTRNRLNKILEANGIMWRVRQRNHVQVLVHVEDGSIAMLPGFQSARFESGVLVAFNEVGHYTNG